MKTKYFFLIVFLIAGAILFGLPFLPDDRLHLVFCNVGEGDAILAKYKDFQAVIDGGPSGDQLIGCLSENIPFWDRRLELMILTHPDNDHLNGLINVLERYDVSQIVVNSVTKDSSAFWEFHHQVLAEGAEIYSPQAGDQFKIGPVKFEVFWPQQKIGDSSLWENKADLLAESVLGAVEIGDQANETSIVLRLSYGQFDALLAGDIGFETENLIDFPEVEVLKIPHHGSKYSTSDDLLEETSPETAIISVGKNPWGHPTQEVIEKIDKLGIKLLRTDEQGEIEIISDGKNWWIKD
jgi:competence protein ComEC